MLHDLPVNDGKKCFMVVKNGEKMVNHQERPTLKGADHISQLQILTIRVTSDYHITWIVPHILGTLP